MAGMNSQELFGVVVRTIGLIIALYGVWYLAFAILRTLGAVSPGKYPPREHFLGGVLFILVGVSLLIGADAIVWIAYRVGK
jgi:hypothetical protein